MKKQIKCHYCGHPVTPEVWMVLSDDGKTTKPGIIDYTCPGCEITWIFDKKYLEVKERYGLKPIHKKP